MITAIYYQPFCKLIAEQTFFTQLIFMTSILIQMRPDKDKCLSKQIGRPASVSSGIYLMSASLTARLAMDGLSNGPVFQSITSVRLMHNLTYK